MELNDDNLWWIKRIIRDEIKELEVSIKETQGYFKNGKIKRSLYESHLHHTNLNLEPLRDVMKKINKEIKRRKTHVKV